MILNDELGNKVDYFEKFPPAHKNIAISLSGGADSALIFYCLMKMIHERQMQNVVSIYPIHGYDISRKNVHSYEAVEKIIEFMEDHWLNYNIIRPLHIFAYDKTLPISKEDYHKANYEYIKRKYDIPFIIRGVTQGMPNNNRPLSKGDMTPDELKHISETTWILPFGSVDKKFIAYQYKVFKLNELYKLTSSCIADSLVPCKTCWWCQEKYWAFGSYDGGVR